MEKIFFDNRQIKNTILLILMTLFMGIKQINAQDIIIKRNGDEIKAKITEVGTTEIKYKKFETLETSPIYSIFKSDVFMIKYADGTKDIFNSEIQQQQQPHEQQTQQVKEVPYKSKSFKFSNKQNSTLSQHATLGQSKFILGTGRSFINSYNVGNLNNFLQRMAKDPTITANAGSPALMMFNFGLRSCMDTIGKTWFGVDLQLVKTAPHAIWGSCVYYGSGSVEMHFDGFFMNIPITYLRGVDQKNNLLLAIEPALDMALIGGDVYVNNYTYTEALSFGAGFHLAVGFDYSLGKYLGINARVGYRYLKTPEMHTNDQSNTGYSSFYVNGVDGETVKVDWSGTFLTVSAYLAFDRKSKSRK